MLTNNECLQRRLAELKIKAEISQIVVEGKRDASALKRLGVFENLFVLNEKNNGKSLYETAEMIATQPELGNKKVLLMFDADRKGLQLSRAFKSHLQQNGVAVDTKTGGLILKAANIRHVEELQL